LPSGKYFAGKFFDCLADEYLIRRVIVFYSRFVVRMTVHSKNRIRINTCLFAQIPEGITDSVNTERLKNNPVLLDKDTLRRVYQGVIFGYIDL